ncbi:MAG TPA: sugar-transfer associated ATP-grasp domain-containing protein, partial [Herpetosiphonaceae bacterium]|nr:sugar-transfer associated ATP-grasp domain-containing protein [Herpetosiphonaceae bacterium]
LKEIRYQGDTIDATTNTDQHLTFAQLAELLDQPPDVKYYMAGGYQLQLTGYLLQAKVQQHPFLSELAPSTTNTVRVVTFLDHTNTVHIHFTILRLGRQGNVADNWDRGGISVAIDPATGVLGAGVLKPKYGGRWLEVHPDSGVRFTGQQLPYWEEIVALCRQAARVLPKVRSIGWDVAITPTGPVLIEGNPDWDLPMVQVHTQGYLQPAIREQLTHLGLRFPEQTLPPVSLRDWSVRLQERYRQYLFFKRPR